MIDGMEAKIYNVYMTDKWRGTSGRVFCGSFLTKRNAVKNIVWHIIRETGEDCLNWDVGGSGFDFLCRHNHTDGLSGVEYDFVIDEVTLNEWISP